MMHLLNQEELLADTEVMTFGIGDELVQQGNRSLLLQDLQLDPESIAAKVSKRLESLRK